MRTNLRLAVLIGLFLLTACGSDTPVNNTSIISTPTLKFSETQTSPTLEQPTENKTEPLPDAGPSPTSENGNVIQPTLFAIPWDDRSPFLGGLIESEKGALSRLSGATIYHIRINIDASLTVVEGQQEIRYTNQEDMELDEIYFHLFSNLLGESISISQVVVNGKEINPDYLFNQSVMKISFPEPLLPGKQIVIGTNFMTIVPKENGRNYGLIAKVDDILALAHFYPIVTVFDDEGWNIEPPAEDGDVVYADTSFYLVEVSAPIEQVVVASGIETGREETDEILTITYASGPARDFYLASSDRYTVISEKVGETQINSYAPAEFSSGARLALDTAVAALKGFGQRLGVYPYTELDIVSTVNLALGVEYPGIFANTIRIYDFNAEQNEIPNQIYLESTTAHETAHQWFYNIIGNDQLDEPWLDESLTQYATWLYYIDRYGESNADGYYQSLVSRWGRVEQADIPIGLPVKAYQPIEYGAIVYGRGPIFVNELAKTMGQDTFNNFLRDYYLTNQWEIATTQGLKNLAEFHCNCDLTRLFNDWVFGE